MTQYITNIPMMPKRYQTGFRWQNIKDPGFAWQHVSGLSGPAPEGTVLFLANRPIEAGIYRIDVNFPAEISWSTFEDNVQGKFQFGKQINQGKAGVWKVQEQGGTWKNLKGDGFDAELEKGVDPEQTMGASFFNDSVIPRCKETNLGLMVTGFTFYLIMAEDWPIPAGLTAPLDVYFDENGNFLGEASQGAAVIYVEGIGDFGITLVIIVAIAATAYMTGKFLDIQKVKQENKQVQLVATLVTKYKKQGFTNAQIQKLLGNAVNKPDKSYASQIAKGAGAIVTLLLVAGGLWLATKVL